MYTVTLQNYDDSEQGYVLSSELQHPQGHIIMIWVLARNVKVSHSHIITI